MSGIDFFQVVLSSSIIASIFTAVVSLKLKNLDYKNEYSKKILDKRLKAYDCIENQIALMKTMVVNFDSNGYYLVFDDKERNSTKIQQNFFNTMKNSIWINKKTVLLMEELSDLLAEILKKKNNENEILLNICKETYELLIQLTDELENFVRKDLLNLHNLKKFAKQNFY